MVCVLVVDDNHDVADSMPMLVQQMGFEAYAAYGGAQAIALARSVCPDIVFLDIGMPQLDGWETACRIRALPEGQSATLVALSGHQREKISAKCRDAGFEQLFLKPIAPDELHAFLSEIGRR